MTEFDQRDQHVETQYNADSINIGVPFEQYKADLADREKEVRQLLVDAALDERKKEDLNRQLAQVEQLRLDERSSYETHVKDLVERIRRLDQLSGQIPDKFIGEAKQALANGDNAKADQLFTQVEEQADPHIAAAAEAAYQRGKLSEDAIKYNEAFRHYQRAIQLVPDNPQYLEDAGSMAGIVANHQNEVEWKEKALAIYLEQEGADSADVARLRNNLGMAWHSLGQYDKAVEYFELALASDLKAYGDDHPTGAVYRNNLGMAWHSLGQHDKAVEYFELALASDLITYGDDHHTVAVSHNNLGSAWSSLGQYDEAIEYYELALASDLKTYVEDHPHVARDRNNLGLAWHSLGQYDKAIEYYELALASGLKTYGDDHPDVAAYRNNLGLAWHLLGKYDKAIEYYELALASDLKTYGDDHPEVATRRNNLGGAWDSLGQYDKAIEYYELALASHLITYGDDHPSTKGFLLNLTMAKAGLLLSTDTS